MYELYSAFLTLIKDLITSIYVILYSYSYVTMVKYG